MGGYNRGMTPLTPLRHAHHCVYDLRCVYDLHYHFVFVVKCRHALLRPGVESERVRLSHEVAQRYEFETRARGPQNQGKSPEEENLRLLFSPADAAPEER